MKKILLSTFALAVLSSGYSQISITKALFEQYHDTTVAFGVSNVSEINIGTNANNGTWDVSNATLFDPEASVIKAYDSNIEGAEEFPSATHYSSALKINGDGSLSPTSTYGFVIINNTGMDLLGTSGSETQDGLTSKMLMKYSPAQKVLTFPFNHQDKVDYNTESTTTIESSPFGDIKSAITGSYTYEGYGKIKYPGDVNYTDCARLHRVETSTSNTEFLVGNSGSKSTTKIEIDQTDFIGAEYKTFSLSTITITSTTTFITQGVEMPPQTDTKSTTSAIFEKGSGKAEIQQIALSQSDEKYFTGVNLYPNPTVDKVSFNSSIPVSNVEVISANGNSYIEKNVDNSLEIKGEKGLYLVKLTLSNGASKSFKVVKN